MTNIPFKPYQSTNRSGYADYVAICDELLAETPDLTPAARQGLEIARRHTQAIVEGAPYDDHNVLALMHACTVSMGGVAPVMLGGEEADPAQEEHSWHVLWGLAATLLAEHHDLEPAERAVLLNLEAGHLPRTAAEQVALMVLFAISSADTTTRKGRARRPAARK